MTNLLSLRDLPPALKARGVWMRTHFYVQGTTLHGTVYLVAGTQPAVVRAQVELGPLIKVLQRYHQQLHQVAGCVGDECGCVGGDCGCVGGDCGCAGVGCDQVGWFPADQIEKVGKMAVSLGKTKLAKGLSRNVKAVIRSDVTRGIVAGAAIVFPPVGAPAYAAYETSRQTLEYYDKAEAARKKLKAIGNLAKNRNRAAAGVVKATGKIEATAIFTGHAQASAQAPASTLIRATALAAIKARRAGQERAAVSRAASSQGASGSRSGIQAAMQAAQRREAAATSRAASSRGASGSRSGIQAAMQAAARRQAIATYQAAACADEAVKRIESDPAALGTVNEVLQNGEQSKELFKKLVTMARYAQDPKKKAVAHSLTRIVNLVNANRNYLRHLSGQLSGEAQAGMTGLVIDSTGRIIPGEYIEATQGRTGIPDLLLAADGKARASYYARIAGCIGCV